MSKVKSTTTFTNSLQKHMKPLEMKTRKAPVEKSVVSELFLLKVLLGIFLNRLSILHNKPPIQAHITDCKHLYSSLQHVSFSKDKLESQEDKIQHIYFAILLKEAEISIQKKKFKDCEFHFSVQLLASTKDNQTVYWQDL